MKTSIVTLCLVLAFTFPLYGAEDRKPDTAPVGVFPKKLDGSGVDNLYQLSDSLYSGSKPDGEEGFRFLSKLGVKTILSVDGVAPEAALAKKYGIGYVHVPISSEAIREEQASQIVKVAAEQPGPLFIHCHYGMNRGPSAAAIVCIAQHGWTPEQATAWMKRAGTSANCTGLFRDVRNFKAHSSVTLTKDTGANLTFDTYSGYFVSSKFEPKAAASFVVIHDQERFSMVFGVAMVMRDKHHRLPEDAFKSLMVIAAIKRGNALMEYKVESVTEAKGVVELKYTTTEKKSDSTTFACPLIVSIPKGEYKAIQFVENGKPVKKVEMPTEKRKVDTSKVKDVAIVAGALGLMAGWNILHTQKVKVTLKDGKITADPQEVKPAHSVVFEVTNASKEAHRIVLLKTAQDPEKLDMDGDKVKCKEEGVKVQPGTTAKLSQTREDNYEGLFAAGTTFVLFCNEPKHYQNGERARVVVK